MQNIPAAQRPPAMAAKLSKSKGTFAAQIIRHLDAAAQAEVASDPRPFDGADFQRRPGRDQQYAVHLLRDTVKGDRDAGAAHHRQGCAMKLQRWPVQGDFQRRCSRRVIQQPVAETQRPIVHRPRRRDAHRPVAQPSGKILDAGLRPGAEHLDGGGPIVQLFQATVQGSPWVKGSKPRICWR